MKITVNIEDWLEAKVTDASGKLIALQDGMQVNVNTAGIVQIQIAQSNDCKNKPMCASSKSGASGSLSFA